MAPSTDTRLSRDDLLAAVDRISDVLRANADAAEEQRTLPLAAVDAMLDEQLFAIAAPEAVGGLEADPLTQMDVLEAVARIDTSAAWTLMIGSHGTQVLGAYASDAAVQQIFGGERWPIAGSQISPFGGEYEVVDGGYRVSGHWTFASGIRHADWSMLTASPLGVDKSAGPAAQIAAVVPASRVKIVDNWHVAGMQGTGSCDYTLEDEFIADEWAWSHPPKLLRGGPRYLIKTPLIMLATFALGAARRSLDEVAAQAVAKIRPGSTRATAYRSYFQHTLGEADINLRAARAGLKELVEELWELAQQGESATPDLDLRLHATPAQVYAVAKDVTTNALSFGGSSALHLDNILQRNWRDVTAASQHFQANESHFEAWGRQLAGIKVPPRDA